MGGMTNVITYKRKQKCEKKWKRNLLKLKRYQLKLEFPIIINAIKTNINQQYTSKQIKKIQSLIQFTRKHLLNICL